MLRMRGSRLMHAIAALVWFGVVAARPVAMPCPMGGHGAVHGAAASHSHHAGMVDAATAGPGAAPETPRETAPPGHPCDCLGHCCAALVARPGAFAPVVAFVERAVESPTPHAAVRYIAPWTDFVLPFAIAPPVSART